MNYESAFYSLPRKTPSAESRYSALLDELQQFTGDWEYIRNKSGKLTLLLPECTAGLSKGFRRRIKSSVGYYAHPTMEPNDHDLDYLVFDFDPLQVDYFSFRDNIVPRLVDVFQAFFVRVYDSDTHMLAPPFKPQGEVGWLGLVNFFDKLLCERAFGMTPAAVVKAVKKDVADAKTLHGGVYIILSKDILGPKEIQEQGKLVRNLLPNSPFKK